MPEIFDYPYKSPRLKAKEQAAAASAPTNYGVSNPLLSSAITGLLTPGLVPDIARQSAEVSAGRGIAGSPAAASTAVRMSEQDYLERLGLANQLMSGEAGRILPYQITPYQALALQTQRDIAGQRYGGGGGFPRGGGPQGGVAPVSTGYRGTGFGPGPFGSDLDATGLMGGGQRLPATLDDAYNWLGFGDFGGMEGDWTNAPQTEGEFMDFLGFEPPPEIPEFDF